MKLVTRLIKAHFTLLLFLVVLISYGQLLGMYVWQDDNGLFFKLAHINEDAGYFGSGPFGIGTYKYTITPYIPIYTLFGYSTFPYFFLNLILYLVATICVYKVFSKVIGEDGGKVAGFLYAAGYIASDGFIRLFSSPQFSISIILVALFLHSYWKFYKQKKFKWYVFSILFFFLALEFIRARTHYFVGVAVFFELIFFIFQKPIKSILRSLLRLIPFISIFYLYYIVDADHRSGNIKIYTSSLLQGDFQKLYGLVSSWANLVAPDWLTDRIYLVRGIPVWLITILGFVLFVVFFLRNSLKNRALTVFFTAAVSVWIIISKTTFNTDFLNLPRQELFVARIGGLLIICFFLAYFLLKKYKKLYLFLFFWALLNILAYSAYNPTVAYESVNRYLTHSLFPLVGIFGIFWLNARGKVVKVLVTVAILFWGLGNLTSAAFYQNRILVTRSDPPRKFYEQLKAYRPTIEKGDIFYFDVADDSKSFFDNAFSVASMPETTAIAWRYGVDRYDLYRVTSFGELISLLQDKNLKVENIYSFFYSGMQLIDTSQQLRKNLVDNDNLEQQVHFSTEVNKDDILILPDGGIESITPSKTRFKISAAPMDESKITFPYISDVNLTKNQIPQSSDLRKLAFEYKSVKEDIWKRAIVKTSSNWRDNIDQNLIDSIEKTAWQADRISWGKGEHASVTLDLKQNIEIDRFVWINAFTNNTPTHYVIESSVDGKNWNRVKEVKSDARLKEGSMQVVDFQKTLARFVKMELIETLNTDSPGVAEIWVVPSKFSSIDIKSAEEFIANPFGFIPDKKSYMQTLEETKKIGDIDIFIKNDKYTDWMHLDGVKLQVVYDANLAWYSFELPTGGTKISMIKLSPQIPGNLDIDTISISKISLKQINGEAKTK